MYRYNKNFFEEKSRETNFIKDNLEKVYRLVDILEYINTNNILSKYLVLKGGTAINLSVFNMPRLSVDIDLDFNLECTKEKMLEMRNKINDALLSFMNENGYSLNEDNTKKPLALDSLVFNYQNTSGNRDNIKIEVNYLMRNHILDISKTKINLDFLESNVYVRVLNKTELFGSKIKALIERTAPRDVYDIYNMIRYGIFDDSEKELLKKCVIFYLTVGSTNDVKNIDFKSIDELTFTKVRQTLLPVLRKSEKFELEEVKKVVKKYLGELMIFTKDEKEYIELFKEGKYEPKLLFDDKKILDRIKLHPMALWKTK